MKHDEIKTFLQQRSRKSILEGFLKTMNLSNTVNLSNAVTLTTEVDSIINLRPLTVGTMVDTKSDMPLLPSNYLTMKPNAIIPSCGKFSRPDLYSKIRWYCVQHIADKFWKRWR